MSSKHAIPQVSKLPRLESRQTSLRQPNLQFGSSITETQRATVQTRGKLMGLTYTGCRAFCAVGSWSKSVQSDCMIGKQKLIGLLVPRVSSFALAASRTTTTKRLPAAAPQTARSLTTLVTHDEITGTLPVSKRCRLKVKRRIQLREAGSIPPLTIVFVRVPCS